MPIMDSKHTEDMPICIYHSTASCWHSSINLLCHWKVYMGVKFISQTSVKRNNFFFYHHHACTITQSLTFVRNENVANGPLECQVPYKCLSLFLDELAHCTACTTYMIMNLNLPMEVMQNRDSHHCSVFISKQEQLKAA